MFGLGRKARGGGSFAVALGCGVALMLGSSLSRAGVLMQAFYWDAPSTPEHPWWDEIASRSSELAKAGFTALWYPPALKGASGALSDGYDPFDDYDLGSKYQRGTFATHWGTSEELRRAVSIARANGLDVYEDLVLAQRDGDNGDFRYIYPTALAPTGGRFEKTVADFTKVSSGFGRQLNYANPDTRQKLEEAGDWEVRALGAQGARIDFAIGVPADFLSDYLGFGALAGKFVVAEYWNEDPVVLENYVGATMKGRVHAFDFPLWGRLKDMANSNGLFDMRVLATAGLVSRDPGHAVTFVENHDTDRSYPTRINKHLSYAFILTSDGYPSVFWKDYYQYGLRPVIDPLIWIHEHLAAGSTEYRWADGNLLVYERHGKRGLLVGINNNRLDSRSATVSTGFGPNAALHDYTSHMPDLRTGPDGKVTLTVGANSYVAYAPVGIIDPNQVASFETTQDFDGATDLDIPPATEGRERVVGRIYVQGGTAFRWTLFPESGPLEAGEALRLTVTDPAGRTHDLGLIDASHSPGTGKALARAAGWYTFGIQAEGSKAAATGLSYRLRVTYQAPGTLLAGAPPLAGAAPLAGAPPVEASHPEDAVFRPRDRGVERGRESQGQDLP